MAKLKDIAEHAGVSIPTANQILNGHESRFSESTCKKVLLAAEELSYRPNIAARSLRFNKSYTVGVLFFAANEKYTTDFMHSVQNVLLKHHYAPIFLTHIDKEEEAKNIEICLERRVDGLIINPVTDQNGSPYLLDKYKKLIKTKIPIIEAFGDFIGNIPHIDIDHYRHGHELTERLIKRGCKNIAFLTHSLMKKSPEKTKKFPDAWGMHNGYQEVIKKHGLNPHIFVHTLDHETDTEGSFYWNTMGITDKIFDKNLNIDGIVCINEEQTLALLNYSNTHNIDLSKFIIATMSRRTNRILDNFSIESIKWPAGDIGKRLSQQIIELIAESKS